MNPAASRAARHVVIGTLLASATPWTAVAQARLGPEFAVNTYTTDDQSHPRAAVAADGSFVVAWTGDDGDLVGIFARRYDAAGHAVGPDIAVNTYTTGVQDSVAVASASDGDFVVVWRGDSDGSMSGVFARRFDSAGTPLADEFQVNGYTLGNQLNPAAAVDADGAFVVVWGGAGFTDSSGVFAKRYDAAGAAIGTAFRVNDATGAGQQRPAVTMTGNGEFVVAFESLASGDIDIFARRFDTAGAPVGTEFQMNTYTTGNQWFPSIAAGGSNGGFVAAWNSDGQDGSGRGVVSRLFSSSGPLRNEVVVNTYSTGDQWIPTVAADAAGNFFVSWYGEVPGGDRQEVAARYYLAPGAYAGTELVVNSYTTTVQQYPTAAMGPDGRFVVAWQSRDQDGDKTGIFAQRYLPERIFADGFNLGTLAAWSGSSTAGGDLTVSPAAGLASTTQGLRALVDDTTGRYVQDDTPDQEGRYRARFYFDTNGFDPGEAGNRRRVRLFIAFEESPLLRRLFTIVLRRLNGDYSLAGRARRDDNTQQDTGFFPITDGEHFVEVEWKRANGPDAEDGSFEMWIDDTSVYLSTALDSSISGVDLVRLGALTIKSGANGTLYFDEFESRRTRSIGPVAP